MKFFLHVYVVPVVVLGILPYLQVWTVHEFVFIYTGISYEIRNCPNFHNVDSSPMGHVLLTNVPC